MRVGLFSTAHTNSRMNSGVFPCCAVLRPYKGPLPHSHPFPGPSPSHTGIGRYRALQAPSRGMPASPNALWKLSAHDHSCAHLSPHTNACLIKGRCVLDPQSAQSAEKVKEEGHHMRSTNRAGSPYEEDSTPSGSPYEGVSVCSL